MGWDFDRATGHGLLRRAVVWSQQFKPVESAMAPVSDGAPEGQATYHFSWGNPHWKAARIRPSKNTTCIVYDPSSAVIHTRLIRNTSNEASSPLPSRNVNRLSHVQVQRCSTIARGPVWRHRLVDEALREYDTVLKHDPLNTETQKEVLFKA